MNTEIKGTIKLIEEPQVFSSGFTKQQIVVETGGKYPQQIAIEFVQDKISLVEGLEVGQAVVVSVDIRGREYNGRYFNSLVGWKIQNMDSSPASAPQNDQPCPDGQEEDSIPF